MAIHIESNRFERHIPLTGDAFDWLSAQRHQERCNGSCQTMIGCDCYLMTGPNNEPSRHDEREWRQQFEDTVPVPQAAEACTELGSDTNPTIAAAFWWFYIVIVVVGVIAGASAFI